MNVYAKFRCTPLSIKKALGILRELTTTTTTRTTRVAFKEAFGSKNAQIVYNQRQSACLVALLLCLCFFLIFTCLLFVNKERERVRKQICYGWEGTCTVAITLASV